MKRFLMKIFELLPIGWLLLLPQDLIEFFRPEFSYFLFASLAIFFTAISTLSAGWLLLIGKYQAWNFGWPIAITNFFIGIVGIICGCQL